MLFAAQVQRNDDQLMTLMLQILQKMDESTLQLEERYQEQRHDMRIMHLLLRAGLFASVGTE